jgi:hypothetical protein
VRSIKRSTVVQFRINAHSTPVRFKVLMTVKILLVVFSTVMLCGLGDGDSMFLWNTGIYLQVYMVLLLTVQHRQKVPNLQCYCSELSSGLYCRVKWLSTDVSEVCTASIIRDDHPWWWRQYNPEDSSEHHTRRRENLKSHTVLLFVFNTVYQH